MMNFKTLVFGVSLVLGMASQAPALADTAKVASTTDCGDGIQMMQYADNAGFELNGGKARLTYDAGSKTMTMIDENGNQASVCFYAPVALISQK